MDVKEIYYVPAQKVRRWNLQSLGYPTLCAVVHPSNLNCLVPEWEDADFGRWHKGEVALAMEDPNHCYSFDCSDLSDSSDSFDSSGSTDLSGVTGESVVSD